MLAVASPKIPAVWLQTSAAAVAETEGAAVEDGDEVVEWAVRLCLGLFEDGGP